MSAVQIALPDDPVGAARSTSRSHVGLVRSINEDRVLDAPDNGLWAVADGMGGHHGGDLAAQSVITALRELTQQRTQLTPALVVRSLEAANDEIFRRDRGAGATVVALSLHHGYAQVVWAGDSRCYRVRDGIVQQLTHDHSVVQELIDAELISPAAAASHPHANVITRALGVQPVCEFETCLIDVSPSDRFLLCSDGLSRSLRHDDLDGRSIETLADSLLAAALERDGSDNITLVLVEFAGA